MKICIIDCIGLSYDGSTLEKHGLGGSESAVILMSKELAKIGFDVTVFNNCMDKKADIKPGTYNDVKYRHITDINDTDYFDVVISSRTYIPFVPVELEKMFMPDEYGRMHNPAKFRNIVNNAKFKILWKHDTFCMGDVFLEELLEKKYIDEVFTLSDFHSIYVSNSDHGKKRIFEIWKNKIFQTRNGIVNYHPWVDVQQKDPNLFVYNASITKGMIPLVTKIWPKIKQRIPDAKLTVIGGYYRFNSDAEPDEQEKMFNDLVKENPFDINFTGVISQKDIADILVKASYFIYPNAFPETFGISSLEALNYNVPLLTNKFGALEETAIQDLSYMIDYGIEPNPLAQWINADSQIDKFVDMTVNAYSVPYVHQQKMNMCNIVKDVSTWDTIALQWKQHLYKKLGLYLSKEDFKTVYRINNRVHKVFGRKFSNEEDFVNTKSYPEKKITVVVPFYNCQNYVSKCIDSIATQNYDNYQCILVNDASTDGTVDTITETISKYPDDIKEKFSMCHNNENMGAVHNQFHAFKMIQDTDSIVMLVDGDDWLVNDNTIFDYYNNLYSSEDIDFTYGSCLSYADNIHLIAQEYSPHIKRNKDYRNFNGFNWGMPYTHLRTFKIKLFENLDESNFKVNGMWPKAGGDNAVFYNLIEQTSKVKAVSDVHYVYNDKNPINDYKVNSTEQNETAKEIVNMQAQKKILIAIPTAKYIEPDTFKSVYDLEIPKGYKVDFQYFYGYNVSQVRNLISDWVIKGYDYLFSIDADMSFPPDTLKKMLSHYVDMVSGVYRQRKNEQIIEIYKNTSTGLTNVSYDDIKNTGLIEINGCGFGCVLLKKELLQKVGYPQFEYHMKSATEIGVSEDNDFCIKVNKLDHKIYCDTSIICDHIGNTVYKIS